MTRTLTRMAAILAMLVATVAASAQALPSGIRPGRPPDPLGGRAEAACMQATPAPGGAFQAAFAAHTPAEDGRK
ncbi:MAG: hypothetical protein NZR01_00505 [Bryobacteraceae bacterium]|nr:hypothetical protein [Bryobacteraceae bacterium]